MDYNQRYSSLIELLESNMINTDELKKALGIEPKLKPKEDPFHEDYYGEEHDETVQED